MVFIFFIGGVILGVIGTLIYRSRERIHGVVHIDHKTKQCTCNLISDEVMNVKKKIAVFIINHQAEISREEQGL
jgi:hypothetical protein